MSGGTNRKIEQQNKMVRKQYKADSRMHDYTKQVNENRYNTAVARTELQQATLDARADAADKTKQLEFKYNQRLQNRQFNTDKEAYNQALKDYDTQTELNSMSGAIALEGAQRKKEEALIAKNFNLEGQRIKFGEQKSDLAFEKSQMQNEKAFVKDMDRIDTDSIAAKDALVRGVKEIDDAENEAQVTFANESARLAENKLNFAKDKLDNDISFLQSSEGWDLQGAKTAYEKQQVPNFNKRISLIIEREKATGKARASGREGLSAEREVTSALADYGRKQAQLVDELVFSQADKTLADTKITGTTTYKVGQKNIDKSIIDEDKALNTLQRDRTVDRLGNEKSKLDLAFTETLAQLGYDQERLDARTTKSLNNLSAQKTRLGDKQTALKDQNYLDKQQIKTTYQSAKAQFNADKNQIKLDEAAANIRAQGQIPARPKKPVPLPAPVATVRTKLPMPTAPITAPKPIKGAIQQTSIWNDIGDGANMLLTIGGLFL